MKTLLIRLEGMQAWGTDSRFTYRGTEMEPSQSGVTGLLACALGLRRDETKWVRPTMQDFNGLIMGVRVDRPGTVLHDFQTVRGGIHEVYVDRNGKLVREVRQSKGVPLPDGSYRKDDAIVVHAHFLADACFLVGLYGQDWLVEMLAKALENPAWPVFLGRKCCPPCAPLLVGVSDLPLLEALKSQPLLIRPDEDDRQRTVRLAFTADTGSLRSDIPKSFMQGERRRYANRTVQSVLWAVPPSLIVPDPLYLSEDED